MQLNVSTCYAMQIMLYLVRNKRVVPSTELSKNLHISQRYILQFTGKLREGSLINSHAGMSGGVTLNKEASEISVYDVIKVMEGDMSIPECLNRMQDCGEPCKNTNLLDTFNILKDYFDTCLKTISFQEIADTNIYGNLSEILGLVMTHIDEMKLKGNDPGMETG